MTWAIFDDSTPSHPKLLRAGAEAAWLWFSSVTYSNNHKLDGRIPKDLVASLYAPLGRKAKALADRLCVVNLWHDRGDHYEIHDYAEHQERALKSVVEAKHEARREYERERKAVQRAGRKAPHVPDDVPDMRAGQCGTASAGVPSLASAGAPAGVHAGAPGIPSHPIPSHPIPSQPHTERERVRVNNPPEVDDDDEPWCPPEERMPLHALVRVEFEKRFEALRAGRPSWTRTNIGHCEAIAKWLDGTHGIDPRAALQRLLDGFFGNAWAAENVFPIGALANRPERFIDASQATKASRSTKLSELSAKLGKLVDASAFERDPTKLRELNAEIPRIRAEMARLKKESESDS